MSDPKAVISDLRPRERLLVINLVREAGLDVSSWAEGKGGAAKASSNPRYCYNWSFEQPGEVIVLCLWHSGLSLQGKNVVYAITPKHRGAITRPAGVKNWNPRSGEINRNIRLAYNEQVPIRVIFVDGKQSLNKKSQVSARLLDPVPWAVAEYDFSNGKCLLVRGAVPTRPAVKNADLELSWFEGTKKLAFVYHRRRELALRRAKIQDALRRNGGRLICEVPNCNFDFEKRYGSLGRGYAQVHHLKPLSDRPDQGSRTTLADLAIVCANCHAMIHIGGQCRTMKGLIT